MPLSFTEGVCCNPRFVDTRFFTYQKHKLDSVNYSGIPDACSRQNFPGQGS